MEKIKRIIAGIKGVFSFFDPKTRKLSKIIIKELFDFIKKKKELKQGGFTAKEKEQLLNELIDFIKPTLLLLIDKTSAK